MNNLSLIGKKAHVTTTADNRQRRVPFIEPMISPKKRKNTTSSRVKRNKQNDAAVKQLLFENRQSQSNDHINYRMENNNNQNNLPINSPNATAWLRSQGLLFQTDFNRNANLVIEEDDTGIIITSPRKKEGYSNMKSYDQDIKDEEEDQVEPPPYTTPPSYWRQRFGSSNNNNNNSENHSINGNEMSPSSMLHVEPEATPSPSYIFSNTATKHPLRIVKKDTDEAEVELEVERWIQKVKETTLAEDGDEENNGADNKNMNITTFNSKSMNEFIDGKKGHQNNGHTSLMDLMSSPGDIRQCFAGYDTSDTENDEEDFEQEEQHAGEARKILRTWLNAEDEAEKIKLRAKTNALLDDAITQDQSYQRQRLNTNNRKTFHETLRDSNRTEIILDKDQIRQIRSNSRNPRLVIEERQRLLNEKRERRKQRQEKLAKERQENTINMSKSEYNRYKAKEESEKRRQWRLRQKEQREKQVHRLHRVSDDDESPPPFNRNSNHVGSSRKSKKKIVNPLSKSIVKLNNLVEQQENEVRQMRVQYQKKLKNEREEKEKARVKEMLKLRLERAKREKILIAKEEMRRKRNLSLLQEYFNNWNQFVLTRFDERCMEEENMANLKVIFLKWSVYVKTALYERNDRIQRKHRIDQYRAWVKKSHIFKKWSRFCKKRKSVRKRQRQIDLFAQKNRKKRVWKRWRLKIKYVVRRRENYHKATLLYKWRRKNNCFRKWCTFVNDVQKFRNKRLRRKKLDKLVSVAKSTKQEEAEKLHEERLQEDYVAEGIRMATKVSPYESKYNDEDVDDDKSRYHSKTEKLNRDDNMISSLHASRVPADNAYEGKYCEFLSAMEKRAEERKIKREARRQRRQLAEQEKLYTEQIREMGKVVFVDAAKGGRKFLKRCEAKRRKLEAKRKADRIELAKRKYGDAIIKNTELCMKYYGFRPWCLFMILARMESVKARNHFHRIVTLKAMRDWKHFANASRRRKAVEILRKEARANTHFRYNLKVKVFDAMLSYHNSLRIREEAVRKQNEYRLQKDCLRYLRIKARELRGERIIRCQRADVFYRKKLVLNLFRSWKTVMPMLREEKKASLRRRALRSKVNSWLKDDDRL